MRSPFPPGGGQARQRPLTRWVILLLLLSACSAPQRTSSTVTPRPTRTPVALASPSPTPASSSTSPAASSPTPVAATAVFQSAFLADSPTATKGKTSFSSEVDEIYVRCQLSPVIEPVVVRSAWQGPQGIRYQDSVTLERGSTLAILAWPRPRQGWPAGSYRVEISKREQTSTLEFTIAGPAAVEPVDHLGLPRRVDGLKPFDEELKTGWPRFMVAAFAKKNGGRQVRVPVKVVSLLGKCQTDQYDCFNIPKHHLQHEKDDESYLSRMGRYYWYDLELTGGDGQVLPLRVVYNEGDADCNDGLWGEMWNRNNYEKVADLTSTGDCESTLTATPAYRARFKSHPFQVPTDADYEGEGFGGVFWRLEYGHDDQLERLLGVGLLLADLQDAKDDIDWQPMSVR